MVYEFGKREHVLEIAAGDKLEAREKARNTLGEGIKILSVTHVPESYSLF